MKKKNLVLILGMVTAFGNINCINVFAEKNDTLVYAGESEDIINPILNNHDELPSIIFSGLMKYDENGKPVCDLAESFDYNKVENSYTFHLRKNVKWQDGEAFSANDVEYTYNELTKDKRLTDSIKSNYEDIKDIKVLDNNTIKFYLGKKNAAILDNLTIGILPRHLLENKDVNTDQFNQQPIGTGKYKFVSWDRGTGDIVLEKNNKYYDKVPNIKKIIYKTVAVESTKATMLKSKEADLAWLNAKYADSFRKNKGFQNLDFKTADYRSIAFDFHTDFWKKNKDSIEALNYGINKDAIVKAVLNNHGQVANSTIQINLFGGNKLPIKYTYDLKKFDEKMENLGWKKNKNGIYERDNQEFKFSVQVRDYEEERVEIAKICSAQLKKAGIIMKVVLVPKFDWKKGYNGFLAGYASPFDPDSLYKQMVTNASDNMMAYSNKKIDEDLSQGRHTDDEEKRKEAYKNFEIDYQKNPGQVLICYLEGNYVGVKGLKGLDTKRVLGHHAVGVMWNIENWEIDK